MFCTVHCFSNKKTQVLWEKLYWRVFYTTEVRGMAKYSQISMTMECTTKNWKRNFEYVEQLSTNHASPKEKEINCRLFLTPTIDSSCWRKGWSWFWIQQRYNGQRNSNYKCLFCFSRHITTQTFPQTSCVAARLASFCSGRRMWTVGCQGYKEGGWSNIVSGLPFPSSHKVVVL